MQLHDGCMDGDIYIRAYRHILQPSPLLNVENDTGYSFHGTDVVLNYHLIAGSSLVSLQGLPSVLKLLQLS